MNLLCRIFSHVFDGFYLKSEKGTFYSPKIFTRAEGLPQQTVYKKCGRCKVYTPTNWTVNT